MSGGAAVGERLAAIRSQLDTVCGMLISPTAETLDRCTAMLESAAGRMTESLPDLGGARGDALALEEAWRVRRCYQRAAALAENAARFHGGWMAVRGAMTGGYTPGGEPAEVRYPGRVFLEA